MFSRDRKRGLKENKNLAATTSTIISVGHKYSKTTENQGLTLEEEDFLPLPLSIEGTPCKEQAQIKALLAKNEGEDMCGRDKQVIAVPSTLINSLFDAMEKLINANTLNMEGMKKSMDFAFD